MKKILVLLSTLFVLVSCDKKDDELPEVTFTLSITGFNITSDDFGSLKSTEADIFDDFNHVFGGGVINFINSDGAKYSIDTDGNSPDGYSFTLAVGSYEISGETTVSPPFGRESMTYKYNYCQIKYEVINVYSSFLLVIARNCKFLIIEDIICCISTDFPN